MWRHGDVFIEACDAIPPEATRLPHLILARGEITGHSHQVLEREESELFRCGESMYLHVGGESATVSHEEHAAVTLPRGNYRVWIQREYSPQAIRRVID